MVRVSLRVECEHSRPMRCVPEAPLQPAAHALHLDRHVEHAARTKRRLREGVERANGVSQPCARAELVHLQHHVRVEVRVRVRVGVGARVRVRVSVRVRTCSTTRCPLWAGGVGGGIFSRRRGAMPDDATWLGVGVGVRVRARVGVRVSTGVGVGIRIGVRVRVWVPGGATHRMRSVRLGQPYLPVLVVSVRRGHHVSVMPQP